MGASNGGLGGVYGGGGKQPQPPSGDGTRGFGMMPRQIPTALGNFGPKSGPANNPGGGWSGGVAAPTPIATPNPIGGQIPGYTPPYGWGDIPYVRGGERPMAPPTTFYAPGSSPMPMPPTGPAASPGTPRPMPPTTSPNGGLGGGVWAGAGPGTPQPMPTPPSPMPMPPQSGNTDPYPPTSPMPTQPQPMPKQPPITPERRTIPGHGLNIGQMRKTIYGPPTR